MHARAHTHTHTHTNKHSHVIYIAGVWHGKDRNTSQSVVPHFSKTLSTLRQYNVPRTLQRILVIPKQPDISHQCGRHQIRQPKNQTRQPTHSSVTHFNASVTDYGHL